MTEAQRIRKCMTNTWPLTRQTGTIIFAAPLSPATLFFSPHRINHGNRSKGEEEGKFPPNIYWTWRAVNSKQNCCEKAVSHAVWIPTLLLNPCLPRSDDRDMHPVHWVILSKTKKRGSGYKCLLLTLLYPPLRTFPLQRQTNVHKHQYASVVAVRLGS